MKNAIVNRKELVELVKVTFASGKPFILTVTGHSMGPTLRHLRDRVVLVSPQKKKPGTGDIVLFRRDDGKIVLHRILRCERNGSFTVNGDAQIWTETVRSQQILAVAEGIERRGKYIRSTNKVYQMYIWVWRVFKPVRPYMIKLQKIIKHISGRKV